MPVEGLRYALWSIRNGVCLGKEGNEVRWSKLHPEFSDSAPTYTREEYGQFLVSLNQTERSILPGHTLIICWPDLPDNRASKTAITNSQLPYWRE